MSAKWKKNGIFLEPLFKYKCLGCKDPLAKFYELGYGLQNFPISDDKPGDYGSYALDRQFHCGLCGWQMNFGIALKKEHWEQIVEYEDERERKACKFTNY